MMTINDDKNLCSLSAITYTNSIHIRIQYRLRYGEGFKDDKSKKGLLNRMGW
jgi:hypothetical protein